MLSRLCWGDMHGGRSEARRAESAGSGRWWWVTEWFNDWWSAKWWDQLAADFGARQRLCPRVSTRHHQTCRQSRRRNLRRGLSDSLSSSPPPVCVLTWTDCSHSFMPLMLVRADLLCIYLHEYWIMDEKVLCQTFHRIVRQMQWCKRII